MFLFILITGIYLTFRTYFFHVTHSRQIFSTTFGSIFQVTPHTATSSESTSISPFQALCTALAGTMGVGNIAGVAAAIVSGGPGAVFWMWVSAFFGMMTHYCEIVLGIHYRCKNADGEWCGGAMYYLRDGLGSKKGFQTLGKALAYLFSIFCVLASFGMGNMSQANTIAHNIISVFRFPALDKTISFGSLYVNLYALTIGFILMLLIGLVILGGIQRISQITEKLVPFMACAYIFGTLLVLLGNFSMLGEVFHSIISFAFGSRALGGAAIGIAIQNAVTWGLKRGIFSNEAGLGSSVIVHAAANVSDPVRQGMWGIFEVFADTIVVCTLTAFAILSSGLIDLQTGEVLTNAKPTALVSEAFGTVFHIGEIRFGSIFIAIAILFFAFATILGWSYYGAKAWEFLFGTRSTIIYKGIFVLFIMIGATMNLDLVWNISDAFNGLMAIPNLIGVLALSGTVVRITKERDG
ncbi:MAG: alanine:cation symporter family protein [Lachnospiraceae bacterium]|nr:alanine:cation symporter family protein [Lachnospiraceae bacterium]